MLLLGGSDEEVAIHGDADRLDPEVGAATVEGCIAAMGKDRPVPAGTRNAQPPALMEAERGPGDCKIQDNIGKSGKIYHMPGSPSYANTKIDESKGERWFCSEEEARAAGWRPPRS